MSTVAKIMKASNHKPTVAESYFHACGKIVEVRRVEHGRLGQMMREQRLMQGTSLRELAATIGWSAPYVSDLELGRRAWNLDRVQRYIASLPHPVGPYSLRIGGKP